MIRTLQLCGLFLLLSFSGRISAQCIDSLAVQYGFACDPRFEPVCGCNGYTYRNDCFARNNGLLTWSQGICDYIDFDINPNPVQNDGQVIIDAIVRNPGMITIEIFDHYGRQFYVNTYYLVDRLRLNLDFRAYPNGLYCVIVRNTDGFRAKKIVRPEY
ncbi:MAG: hypothetical protein FD123_3670 [Bacteroidetes bacterium]|nr:MAG: hypothetical protein FD123_3670 [Bacteroidota bacterium]